jgi:hypothetical protein
MTEEPVSQTEQAQPEPQPAASDPWKEVGRQFQALGESLAAAFQAAWNNESVRRHAGEMRTGLESMAKEVGQAVKAGAESAPVQQARTEAGKTVDTLVNAGEETVQEIRPHLVSALRTVNQELEKFIRSLESRPETAPEAEPAAETTIDPEPPAAA